MSKPKSKSKNTASNITEAENIKTLHHPKSSNFSTELIYHQTLFVIMRHVAGRALVSLIEAFGCIHEEETVPIFCAGNLLSFQSKIAHKNI